MIARRVRNFFSRSLWGGGEGGGARYLLRARKANSSERTEFRHNCRRGVAALGRVSRSAARRRAQNKQKKKKKKEKGKKKETEEGEKNIEEEALPQAK